MTIDAEKITEIVNAIEQAGSLAEAVDTIDSGDADTLTTLAAVNTLASLLNTSEIGKIHFGTFGLALNTAALAETASDGEFNFKDVSALSAGLGAALARSPNPYAQGAAIYFNAYALAIPYLNDYGRRFGQELPLPSDINGLWDNFKDWFQPPTYDPLALDLDGDGIETIGADGSVLFDLDGDGIKNGTGWVSADDGFLVLDRDGNGTIDTGAELFGVDTVKADGNKATDGFDALSDLDTNTDGLFDQNDIEFANVQVWQDLNQDGISTENELSSLTDLGIVSIDLNADSNNVNLGNGNVQSATSAHLTQEGVEGETGNLDLASNPFYREFTDSIELSEQALSLPDAVASGLVRDLREAVTLSPELGALLDDFSSDTSYQGQHAKLDTLFTAWAETSTMESSVQAAEQEGYSIFYLRPDESEETYDQHLVFWNDTDSSALPLNSDEIELFETLRERQQEVTNLISTLERFNGEGFVEVETDRIITGAGNPVFVSSNVGSDGVERDRVFVFLSDQQIDFMSKSYNLLKESVYGSLVVQTRLSEYLDAIQLGVDEGGELFIDYSEMNTLLDDNRVENPTEALADLIELNRYSGQSLHKNNWDGLETLRNWINEDEPGTGEVLDDLNVSLADGVFYVDSTDDVDTFNSMVFGGVGDDTLSGDQLEVSNETLSGGAGNDNIYGQAGNDVLFGNAGNDNLDGGIGNDILDGGDGNDNLEGGEGDDLLRGGAGDDSLSAGSSGLSDLDGNNDLFGGSGDDYLSGGAGNDLLEGGTGNDTLEGWGGVDTFVFNLGDGHDTIIDDYDGIADDKVAFGAGISTENLQLRRDTDTLIVEILDDQGGLTGDSLTIQGAFWDSPEFLMGSFEFADGSSMTAAEISAAARALVGTDGDDILSGDFDVELIKGLAGNDTLSSWNDAATLIGGEGNDTLLSNDGNALLDGGSGNDTLTGSWGNDHLEGGAGSDTLSGGGGADTYVFNLGDGQDTITDDAYASSDDKIVFGAGITAEHLQLRRDDSVLIIDILNDQGGLTGDSLSVGGAFWGTPDYAMGSFEFDDGSTMTATEITAAASILVGTAGDDVISGSFDGDTIKGLAGNDTLTSDGGEAALFGGEGNDSLQSYDGNASLDGGAGDDTLTGSWGNDVLEGGAGNDTLTGGGGADTYIFNLGDGQDTIVEDLEASADDKIAFGAGIAIEHLQFRRVNNTLHIELLNDQGVLTGDAIAVEGAFWDSPEYVMGSFEFADGSIMTTEEISAAASALIGTDGDDVIMGGFDGDTIKGLAGNDTLTSDGGDATLLGGEGNDTLESYDGNATLDGGAGDDTLTGSWGNDVLEGGAGNDTLTGGGGEDTYLFNLGDGQDTVEDDFNDTDKLVIAGDVAVEDLWFSSNGIDLQINIAGTDDQVVVNNWDDVGMYQLSQIEVGSSVLLNNQVEQLVSAMASYNVPSGAGDIIPQEVKDALQPVIAQTWQTT